jgi:probable blue pigment (indigoidine) exporter
MAEQRAGLPGRWLNAPASSRRVALGIGVLVTFLWATSVVLIRIGVSDEDIDPIGFAAVRFLLAALLLLPLAIPGIRAAPTWRTSRRWLLGVAVYGLLIFGAAQVGFYVALGEVQASTVGLFMGVAPVVTAMVAVRNRRERASALQAGGIAVLIVGVVVYFGLEAPPGDATAGLLAAASIPIVVGGAAVLGRRVAVESRDYGGPASMTAIAMLVGAGMTFLLALLLEGVPSYSPAAWLLIVWLAVINTALTYTLWAQSQRSLRAVESSVLGDLTVIQVAVLGWIVLGEALDPAQMVGLGLALSGVVIVQLAPWLRLRFRRAA